jgi:hypothetical protein
MLYARRGRVLSLSEKLLRLLDYGEDPGLPRVRPVGAHAQAHLLRVRVSLR